MVLPLLKLGTLALKTISKPIASRLKQEAVRHPEFGKLIGNFAQINHRITTTLQRRLYGHATDVEIRPLDEQKAVQVAGDLLGEMFVFSVGVAALIFEVQRSSRSEAKKEAIRRQEMEAMRQRDEDLAKEVELLKQKLAEIEQIARGRGIAGVFNFKQARAEEAKPAPAA